MLHTHLFVQSLSLKFISKSLAVAITTVIILAALFGVVHAQLNSDPLVHARTHADQPPGTHIRMHTHRN